MIRSPFGKKLRELREQKEISVRKFAAQLGFSAAYISDIERGLRLPPADERVAEMESILSAAGILRRMAQVERIGVRYGELSQASAEHIVDIMAREGVKI